MQNTTAPGSLVSGDDHSAARTAALAADPYAVGAELRRSGPVHRITGPDGRPAWLVTRYPDVRQALTDPRLSLDKRHAMPGNYRGFSLPPALDANLLNMDPPDHTRVRRLVAKAFTPRLVERLRAPVRRVADALLDAVEDKGRMDVLASYAGPLPITVICDVLGVPQPDRHDFRIWTDAMLIPDPARPQAAREAVGAMLRFLTALIASKRAAPGDDLLSDLISVRENSESGRDAGRHAEGKDEGESGNRSGDEADGDEGDGDDRLSEEELTSLAFLILFAGYENTVHLIANSILALLDHPDLLRRLRGHPAELASAIDELMRFEGPALLAIRRFPIEDLSIGSVAIPAGETVLLSLASANRDPEHFPDPDRLDPRRPHSGHLALGYGIHYCLGAPLARMETEVALAALLERLPELRLAVPREELRWRPSVRARGLISLPVAWSAADYPRS